MLAFDVFQTFRFGLALFVGIYAALNLLRVLRRWVLMPLTDRGSRVLWRYGVVLLLRTSPGVLLRGFLEIAALLVLLWLVVKLHS